MIRIVFGGDICPTGRIQNAFEDGNADEIFHDLLEDITYADLSVVNLECPLVSRETPINKGGGGPVLGASSRCIRGFAAANWSVLNLANNHSFDHGACGLRETIDTIRGAGLGVVGAGLNISEAQMPFVTIVNGQRIVIYAMAEREYSVADSKTPGANPLDIINFVNAIRQHKQDDIFIVLIHGGSEYYPYPSPEMRRKCRFMVDIGADAVICCHAHIPLPWEIYRDRPIVYGLGNLIFEGLEKKVDAWYEGYLGRLMIEGKKINFEAIPHVQSRDRSGAQKMKENARKLFFDEMEGKIVRLKDAAFIEDQWGQYCLKQKDLYLSFLFGYKMRMRNWRKFFLPLLHSKDTIDGALLLAQCETHQEILNTIFRNERQGDYDCPTVSNRKCLKISKVKK